MLGENDTGINRVTLRTLNVSVTSCKGYVDLYPCHSAVTIENKIQTDSKASSLTLSVNRPLRLLKSVADLLGGVNPIWTYFFSISSSLGEHLIISFPGAPEGPRCPAVMEAV